MSKRIVSFTVLMADNKFNGSDFDFFLSKPCKEYKLMGIKGMNGSCFIKDVKETPPKWKEFIEDFAGTKINDLLSKSSSAVLLIKAQSRIFAITFGYGKSLLEQSYFVSDFGIKSALNMLKHDSLRSVDTFTIDDSPVQKKTQASLGTEISMFGVDISKDILRSVTGTPIKGIPFNNISGGDSSLQVKAHMEPQDLLDYLKICLDAYNDTAYLKQFSWVDNLKKVGATAIIEILDNELIKKIKNKKHNDINIIVPEVMSDDSIEYFSFTRSKNLISYDIDKKSYFDHIDILRFDLEKLKRDKLFGFNSLAIEEKSFSMYKCLNTETVYNNENYMLFLGQWFKIEKKFSNYVNQELKVIPTHPTSFPDLIRTIDKVTKKERLESEGDYNFRISKSNNYILLDKKLVKSSRTTTAIELCDLADVANKFLIHAKHRKGGSSGLSHLFAQANVASELILSDKEFRAEARKVIKKNHGNSAMKILPANAIKSSEYEIVLLVLGCDSANLIKDLPFFSKVNLINTFSNLTQRGFKVSVASAK